VEGREPEWTMSKCTSGDDVLRPVELGRQRGMGRVPDFVPDNKYCTVLYMYSRLGWCKLTKAQKRTPLRKNAQKYAAGILKQIIFCTPD